MGCLRWIGRYLGTFLLSLLLAIVVWTAAVTETNPNQERTFYVPLDVLGRETNTEIISDIPERVQLSLYAPRSNLDRIAKNNSALRAWVDLSDLVDGTYSVPVHYQIPDGIRPVRVISQSPEKIEVQIEALITATIPIRTAIRGEPALGYQTEPPEWSATQTEVFGRSSLVKQASYAEVTLDISGATETIERSFRLGPRDKDGNIIPGLTLNPETVSVTQPIVLMGGYRNMVVKVVTIGQVAEGYRQTNITVSPPNVMLFSANPALLDQLPGYVETQVLDIEGATDDIETVLSLSLPEGISVIGDNRVLVFIGVAAIEGSVTLSLEVEAIGLLPDLAAQIAPATVDVIIAGPIPDLENISPVDVRVVVDLAGLEIGTHQIRPSVEILPDGLYLESISPETVEVVIAEAPPPTPTPVPVEPTPTP
jgi:YbbR domain-containing protein